MMKRTLFLFLLFGAGTAAGQSYPLSENTWSNPEFVDRFMGSFGFDTEVTPSVSQEESEIFRQVSRAAGRNPAEAIRLLREALTEESSGAVDFALANFLLQQNDFEGAIASYRTAVRKFPNFGRAYKNLGLAYIQQQNFEEALVHLTKALEILGADGGLLGLIGYCHLNLGSHGPALDAYRFALVYEPESLDWSRGQLKALQQLRKYGDVENIIYRYLEENPEEPEFWLQQANAFIAQKKYAQAAANFEIVKMLNGGDSEMLVLLGDIYVNLDAPVLAIGPYEAALATGEVEAGDALNLAKTLSRRLPPEKSKGFLEKIEATYGDDLSKAGALSLLTLQAGNALAMGDKETAMEALGEVVSKDPLNGEALLTLGRYYYSEGSHVKALDYYGRAEKVDAVKVDALLGSARVLVKQGKYREAIYRLKEAQTLNDQAYIAQYIETLQNSIN